MSTDLEILEHICRQCNLGALACRPLPLQGGFLHKMYSLFTSKGRYAVKLLNPFIMRRENAMDNYQTAEKLELLLEENSIPILPALVFGNRKMQKTGEQYFYLYEWYDGRALRSGEIKELHCRKIGNLLARIHKLDRRKERFVRGEIHVDWDSYIKQLASKDDELCKLLKENRDLLYESQNNGNIAAKKLPQVVAVCHNDMDRKNVLWAGNDCRIIDLECLGYSSPYIELYETALCWSGYEECRIDYGLLQSFLCSYAEAGGQLPMDQETVYWSNYGRLEWLEYNVKRALGIECSAEEIAVGISEAKDAIAHVVYYYNAGADIINCLRER